MKSPLQKSNAPLSYNECVKKAYFQILKQTKALIATIERHELRCTLQRADKPHIGLFTKPHELISPLLYLSLECLDGEMFSIHYGFEQFKEICEYSLITAKFVRILYKLTSVEHTAINIEGCINTDYVVNDCSALFEVVEDSNKHHEFKLIPYKPKSIKRKLLRVA